MSTVEPMAYLPIEKEEIANLHFPKTEVLEDKDEMKLRKAAIDRALILGNVEHGKIKISFADDTTKHVVETTIWGVTEERIILKKGIAIPINRIYEVQ